MEIKHSVVCQHTPHGKIVNGKIAATRTHSFFVFSALQGTHRKGKEADVYVLVGSTHNSLRFFVLSSDDLKKKNGTKNRDRIAIFIDKKRYANTGIWLKYEVPMAELQNAVTRTGISQIQRQQPSHK